MTVNPAGDSGNGSLYLSGLTIGAGHGKFAEINIPTPIIDPDLNNLTRATTIQAMADIAPGLHPNDTQTTFQMSDPLFGAVSNKLMWTRYIFYLPASEATLGCSSTTISSPAPTGPWKIGPTQAGNYGGATLGRWLFMLPQSWADAHTGGRALATGRFRTNANAGGTSWGPSLFALPMACTSGASDAVEVMHNTSRDTRWAHETWADDWNDADWVTTPTGNKAAMVVAGAKAEREDGGNACGFNFCGSSRGAQYYGHPQAHDCGGKGNHGAPIFGALLFYNVNQLASAADGSIAKDSIDPYAIYQIRANQYLTSQCKKGGFGGIAYDSTHHRLYVAELNAELPSTTQKPIIHVWAVADGGGSADTTAPAVPTGLHTTSVSGAGVALAWNAVTDPAGGVVYIVYRNPIDQELFAPETTVPYGQRYPAGPQPFAITSSLSYTDDLEINSGITYTYYVAARDSLGNTSARSSGVTAAIP
jgi:hypothetical protein